MDRYEYYASAWMCLQKVGIKFTLLILFCSLLLVCICFETVRITRGIYHVDIFIC